MEKIDKRRFNKGLKGVAGRKRKSDEIKLIERLDNIINSDAPIELMKQLMEQGNVTALKLYFSYRYGLPKADVNVTAISEVPLFNIEIQE